MDSITAEIDSDNRSTLGPACPYRLTYTGYSYWDSERTRERALTHARGNYQRAIINGYHTLSGSSLRGAAKSYSGRYKISIAHLIERLDSDEHLEISERVGPHGKRILELSWVD